MHDAIEGNNCITPPARERNPITTGVLNLWYAEAFQEVREISSKNAKNLFSRNPQKNFYFTAEISYMKIG